MRNYSTRSRLYAIDQQQVSTVYSINIYVHKSLSDPTYPYYLKGGGHGKLILGTQKSKERKQFPLL